MAEEEPQEPPTAEEPQEPPPAEAPPAEAPPAEETSAPIVAEEPQPPVAAAQALTRVQVEALPSFRRMMRFGSISWRKAIPKRNFAMLVHYSHKGPRFTHVSFLPPR